MDNIKKMLAGKEVCNGGDGGGGMNCIQVFDMVFIHGRWNKIDVHTKVNLTNSDSVTKAVAYIQKELKLKINKAPAG